jgi:F-type H+-transporting ATPase subunit b
MRRSAYIPLLGIVFFGVAKFLNAIDFWKVAGLRDPHGYLTQGFIFLGLLFVLQNLLFEPYVRVLEERHEQTVGKKMKAEQTRLEAEGMIAKYRDAVSNARNRAAIERERRGLEAEGEERQVLKAAKDLANADLRERVAQIQSEAEVARLDLRAQTAPLASDIVQQAKRTSPNQQAFSFVGEGNEPQRG